MKRVLHLVAASALFGCAAVPSAVDARGSARQPELAAVADDAAPRFVTDDNARRIFCGAAPGCAAATADAAVVADEVTLFRLDTPPRFGAAFAARFDEPVLATKEPVGRP